MISSTPSHRVRICAKISRPPFWNSPNHPSVRQPCRRRIFGMGSSWKAKISKISESCVSDPVLSVSLLNAWKRIRALPQRLRVLSLVSLRQAHNEFPCRRVLDKIMWQVQSTVTADQAALTHFPEICAFPSELFERNGGLSRHFADRISHLGHQTFAHQSEELKRCTEWRFRSSPAPLHPASFPFRR